MAWRKPTNTHEWLAIIQSHKKKFFFPAAIVSIAMVIASLWIPRKYQAEAIFERQNDPSLEQMGSGPIDDNVSRIRQVLSQDILGRTSLEQLIEDLQMTRDLPHNEEGELTQQGQQNLNDLIHELQRSIRVMPQVRTKVRDRFKIVFTHQDRELAPRVVNKLMDNYIRKARHQLNEMLFNSKQFFEDQLTYYEDKIRTLEKEKLDYEMEHPGLLPNDPNSVEVKLKDLRDHLSDLTNEWQIAKETKASVEQFIQSLPEYIESSRTGQNPELASLLDKKRTIETELESHLYGMGRTEDHPLVRRTRQRLNELNELIQTTEQEVVVGKVTEPNVKRLEMKGQIMALSGKISAQERRRQELKEEIEDLEVFERNFFVLRNKYQRILNELKDASSQRKFWSDRLQDTTVALNAEIAQRGVRLQVVEHAPDIVRPSSPTLPKIIVMAGAAGLGVGVALIFLAELLDGSFRSIEQAVDDLKLPVLGAVNEIVSPSEVFRRKVFGLGVFPALAGVISLLLIFSIAMARLSLQNPTNYDKFIDNPKQYLQSYLG